MLKDNTTYQLLIHAVSHHGDHLGVAIRQVNSTPRVRRSVLPLFDVLFVVCLGEHFHVDCLHEVGLALHLIGLVQVAYVS